MIPRVARWLALHRNLFGIVPVIVYQMAKVGSSTIASAVEARGLPVFQVHRMNAAHLERMRSERRALGWSIPPVPPHDRLGMRIRRSLIDRGGRAKIVTLVRDPIARNLSSYFEHLDFIWNMAKAHEIVSPDALAQAFRERFPHAEPLTWFDDEMLPVTGIDVYQHQFPASGQQTIYMNGMELLILKSELPDGAKRDALANFLDLDDLTLAPANRTYDKPRGVAYAAFVRALRLDAALVDRMLESRYATHFYSSDEREQMRRKYIEAQ